MGQLEGFGRGLPATCCQAPEARIPFYGFVGSCDLEIWPLFCASSQLPYSREFHVQNRLELRQQWDRVLYKKVFGRVALFPNLRRGKTFGTLLVAESRGRAIRTVCRTPPSLRKLSPQARLENSRTILGLMLEDTLVDC